METLTHSNVNDFLNTNDKSHGSNKYLTSRSNNNQSTQRDCHQEQEYNLDVNDYGTESHSNFNQAVDSAREHKVPNLKLNLSKIREMNDFNNEFLTSNIDEFFKTIQLFYQLNNIDKLKYETFQLLLYIENFYKIRVSDISNSIKEQCEQKTQDEFENMRE